jgi:hypothetical protein
VRITPHGRPTASGSPSGRTRTRNRASPTELSLIHPDGSGLRHLKTPEDDVLSAAFSPDGEWISFGAPGVGHTYDVWAMRVDGSDMHPITRTTAWDSAPDWGP